MGETTSLYKKGKGKNNGIVEEEDFISDPLVGAFLNQKDEIIVNDTLYKFSKRKGIFFSHVKDSASLFQAYDKIMKKDNKILPFQKQLQLHWNIKGIAMKEL
ncbi:hypothetical protein F6U93_02590 [Tamlana haliotis]|uniref:Uncharacterized protein n=1 Tax=Pseudotamlana haliotis TaxID=2614804 RepID=A0A6N6MMY7_9FLAO|nr:hypothetical protein [Tamlana haliotis]KAB1069723.1 hypothetical protein F6U93_02590 [Tamlana haliotis]